MAVQQTTQPTRPTRREKVGVIDVGGGLRSAYSTGVLDYCLDNGIHFDYGLGVSAGAANITSYLAGQRGRPLRFYTKYCPRPEYMSLGNFLRDGSYLGLDYIYGTLMNEDGEDPLDYDALVAGGVPYRITVTDALSGMPKYLGPESTTTRSRPPPACRCSTNPTHWMGARISTARSATRFRSARRLPMAARNSSSF